MGSPSPASRAAVTELSSSRPEVRLVAVRALRELDGAAVTAASATAGAYLARRETRRAPAGGASAAGACCVYDAEVPVRASATVGNATDPGVVSPTLLFERASVAKPISTDRLADAYWLVCEYAASPSQACSICDAGLTEGDRVRRHAPAIANPARARVRIGTQLAIRDRVFQHAPYQVADAAVAAGAVAYAGELLAAAPRLYFKLAHDARHPVEKVFSFVLRIAPV